ncbi:PREDICTED: mRNA-decapping enzyme 1A-like, partial [Tinamus guttatus]|uniref:mRNA-decapping enzyme 1A-like n=1 Tax=Tinamus guttatus TaxID=94827 RepID=UPI00052EC257
MHNLVEPVNKDLEFQLHEPFLLYRNASLSIYSIWFYDKNDCHRIAKLMAKVVEQEAQRSQQVCQDRKSPSRPNGCSESRPIDILEMLSKAKDEYERNQINDLSIVSSSGMQQNTSPSKPESTETSEQATALQVQDQCPPVETCSVSTGGHPVCHWRSPLGHPERQSGSRGRQHALRTQKISVPGRGEAPGKPVLPRAVLN